MGIAALVLGIASIPLAILGWIGAVPGVLGLIFGIKEHKKCAKAGYPTGKAMASIICSIIGITLSIVVSIINLTMYYKQIQEGQAERQMSTDTNNGAGNAGHSGYSGQNTIPSVSVENMFNDYAQDQQKAQQKYGGNRFRFVGVITNDNPNIAQKAQEARAYAIGLGLGTVLNLFAGNESNNRLPYAMTVPVTLRTGGGAGWAVAEFSTTDAAIFNSYAILSDSELSGGKAITFDANVVGVRDGYILLTNCAIVN
jgi:hypothetical protein